VGFKNHMKAQEIMQVTCGYLSPSPLPAVMATPPVLSLPTRLPVKGAGVKSHHLMAHIVEKAKGKPGSDDSLLFPLPFLKYLQDVVFANFNVEAGDVDMSRNTSSHGVAAPAQYTKERALQLILILDQIYFYG
jgi:hypothetical protein